MIDERALESSEFHDAELSAVKTDSAGVRMTFSNVLMSTTEELYYRVTIDFGGVRELTRDDAPVAAIKVEGEGSSVITFKHIGNRVTLLLDWEYYSEKRSDMALYKFIYDDFHLRGELQDGFAD